jgi:hypothetical protein
MKDTDLKEGFFQFLKNVSGAFIFSFASTVDQKHLLPEERINGAIENVLQDPEIENGVRNELDTALAKFRQGQDAEITIPDKGTFKLVEEDLRGFFHRNLVIPDYSETLGSGASYSFSSAASLFRTNPRLASFYVGTLPESVLAHLMQNKSRYGEEFIKRFLEHSTLSPYNPRTFSLEVAGGKKKFMIAQTEGRNPEDVYLADFQRGLEGIFSRDFQVFGSQLGSFNKGEVLFHQKIRKAFETSSKEKRNYFYAGTSNFKKNGPRTAEICRIIYTSDIISFNETELNQIVLALGSNPSPPENGYSQRGRDLACLDEAVERYNLHKDRKEEERINVNPSQLKICHSANGALAYLKADARVVNFISDILGLAVDGTTFCYENDSYPDLEGIMSYSRKTRDRNSEEFARDFGKLDDLSDVGVAYAISPRVYSPKGSLTGLGAVEDGMNTALFTLALHYLKTEGLIN